MNTRAAGAVEIVEATDPEWDRLAPPDLDPHCLRDVVLASAGRDTRPALLCSQGHGWSASAVALLVTIEGGGLVARSPLYGGPWIAVTDASPAVAAETMRGALDAALRGLGVISDVTIMSPWTPHRAAVDAAWSATPGKSIGLLDLGALADRWEVLGSTRRSEVRRGRREGTRVERFDIAAARRFSTVYEEAMEARAADARWRRGSGDFERLAGLAGSRFRLCVCEGSGGGAAALFLTAGARAAYHLAVRWGNLPGAASTVLWVGAEALAAEGCEELLLGGGVTDADDDPLLRFKQAFASRCEPLRVAARAFDRRAHEASAAAGHVRPLPGAAVDA